MPNIVKKTNGKQAKLVKLAKQTGQAKATPKEARSNGRPGIAAAARNAAFGRPTAMKDIVAAVSKKVNLPIDKVVAGVSAGIRSGIDNGWEKTERGVYRFDTPAA